MFSSSKTVLLLELHYLPCLEYFVSVARAGGIVLERQEHYVRQSARNRTYVMAAGGARRLTVPVKKARRPDGRPVPYGEVAIDNGQNWRRAQRRGLREAYAHSPFYDHYAEELESIVEAGHEGLYDLNTDLLTWCLRLLGLSPPVSHTESYGAAPPGIRDIRGAVEGKPPGRLEVGKPYCQVFGSAFVPNLSILDLLFCAGPEAPDILRRYGESPFAEP